MEFFNTGTNIDTYVITVIRLNNPKTLLAEKMIFESKNWAMENTAWIDDNSFIVKAYSMREESRYYDYYLSKIDR